MRWLPRVSAVLSGPISRRGLLGATGAGFAGANFALLGCDSDADPSTAAKGSPERDIELLNGLLEIELEAVVAYSAGIELLEGDTLREFAELFSEQESEHAEALGARIEDLGGTPVGSESEERGAKRLRIDELKSQEEMLRFAIDLENEAIGAYIGAVPELSTTDLRRTAYEIVANEAQHITVLLGALGETQVPDAFVTGVRE